VPLTQGISASVYFNVGKVSGAKNDLSSAGSKSHQRHGSDF
jgi:hypothetical protein